MADFQITAGKEHTGSVFLSGATVYFVWAHFSLKLALSAASFRQSAMKS
jgi:hypothetical protein